MIAYSLRSVNPRNPLAGRIYRTLPRSTPLLESLKHRLLEWLNLATKEDVENAFKNALLCNSEIIEVHVPKLVKQELDKDERTIVFDPQINVSLEPATLTEFIRERMAEAIAKEAQPGGLLRK